MLPSRSETFGNIIIEALASGTPVAAYPVAGPIDIIGDGIGGIISTDLRQTALAALNSDRQQARQRALRYTWTACAKMFLDVVGEAMRSRPKLASQ